MAYCLQTNKKWVKKVQTRKLQAFFCGISKKYVDNSVNQMVQIKKTTLVFHRQHAGLPTQATKTVENYMKFLYAISQFQQLRQPRQSKLQH